ncbi:MAG: YkgJ family cysteine cluster protein [Methanothrix sp.]|nr:YkgJ family cysteine cluster protein [Methanothrix sp.]
MPRVFIRAAFESIRFECQRCGSCCHHRRPEGFGRLIPAERLREFSERSNLIYLTADEVERISRETGRRPEEFVETLYRYDGRSVRVEGDRVILDLPVLRSNEDTTCIFYDRGCTIYPLRPRACRLFPFRAEERSSAEGDLELLIRPNLTCPGVGKGAPVEKEDIERLVAEQFEARSSSITAEVRRIASQGGIRRSARVYRAYASGR